MHYLGEFTRKNGLLAKGKRFYIIPNGYIMLVLMRNIDLANYIEKKENDVRLHY